MKKALTLILLMASIAMATVSDISNTANFALNGVTTEFTFNFPIPGSDTSQIDVILVTVATGLSETLTETTEYSIAATNNDFSTGGVVTTVATYSSSFSLTVVRVTPLTQTADLSTKSSVSYASLESYFDKLTMMEQDRFQDLSLTFKAPAFDSGTSYTVPEAAERANKFFAFDSLGNPIASTGGITGSPASAYGLTVTQSANAAANRVVIGLDTGDDVQFAGITGTTGAFSGLITANAGITLGADDDLIGSATSDITINTDKFTVAGATGDTLVGGTFDVVGNIDPTSYETTRGGFLDEDAMASNSAVATASQQSIKAYIDSLIPSSKLVVKGWVNFTGATATINDSFNITSVMRNSAGNYTITWDTDFANSNYALSICVPEVGGATTTGNISSLSDESCVIITKQGTGVLDFTPIMVIAIGTQ